VLASFARSAKIKYQDVEFNVDFSTEPGLADSGDLETDLTDLLVSVGEAAQDRQKVLVLFIDEAHVVFENASKTLLDQLETIVKLIRSKGIGVYFVTQNPKDIPADILSQLGLKIQHALRAFTAKDRKAIKLAAENYLAAPRPFTICPRCNVVLKSISLEDADNGSHRKVHTDQ